VPAFVSTLCICIVFVPVAFISGAAKYLFTPLAMAVVFAMMTSYLLSRTLVPTLVRFLLASEVERYGGRPESTERTSRVRLALIAAAAAVAVIAVEWNWVVRNPRTVASIALAVCGAAALFFLIDRLDAIWKLHYAFDRQFERLRRSYGGVL